MDEIKDPSNNHKTKSFFDKLKKKDDNDFYIVKKQDEKNQFGYFSNFETDFRKSSLYVRVIKRLFEASLYFALLVYLFGLKAALIGLIPVALYTIIFGFFLWIGRPKLTIRKKNRVKKKSNDEHHF